ncbi:MULTISPECIES: hypothetical protein [unclassified Amycolatopsis]|uniref:hypothetical protein n=1 Tax=unclassified Amycolatopsis TaxID=2618356 RepID=UPI002876CFDF|nr:MULTISPECIES: hypothetical protein [unclassified Amycolatopsis]MDS0140580.1 hypothetical protein [Amycolatopsis sp. 505]MDS0149230.1 hypothetical protein [Amycolatopsis sp. CM201R]
MSDEMDHDVIARRWDAATGDLADGGRMDRDEVAGRWDLLAEGGLSTAPAPHDEKEERRRRRRRRRSADLNSIVNSSGNLL